VCVCVCVCVCEDENKRMCVGEKVSVNGSMQGVFQEGTQRAHSRWVSFSQSDSMTDHGFFQFCRMERTYFN